MIEANDALTANWRPQSWPQQAALQSRVEMLLYGGSVGSLKTETILVDAVRYRDNHRASSIIFRKTNPELQQLVMRSRELYSQCGATYNETKKLWTFPSGMKMRFGWAVRDADIYQYQGDQYDFEGWDESTHHTEFRIRYMLSRLRSRDPEMQARRRVRLTTNPGNIGHLFHKSIFLGATCPHCKMTHDTRVPGKVYDNAKWPSDGKPVLLTTAFIPGNITDHSLLGKDYEERTLASLPSYYSKALKEGCWEMFEGQYYDVWNEERMTIPKRELDNLVQSWWPRWTGTDYGFGASEGGSQAASHLLTRSPATSQFPKGRVFVLDEYCAKRELAGHFAAEQRARWGLVTPAYLSPDCWNKRGDGHTLADQMQEESGIMYEQASNDRVGGAMLIYSMLERGELVICRETCPQLIKSLPSRVHDPDRGEDVLKVKGDPLDDVFDDARYGLYSYINKVEKPRDVQIEESVTSQDPTVQALQRRQAERKLDQREAPVGYTDYSRLRGY